MKKTIRMTGTLTVGHDKANAFTSAALLEDFNLSQQISPNS
jgi:hypothetical protein